MKKLPLLFAAFLVVSASGLRAGEPSDIHTLLRRLDGLLDRMEAELGTPVKVVATGGIARFVIPLCRRELIYDRSLMLKGLGLLYRRNAH